MITTVNNLIFMSGHNKWSKIHRQKSVADNKKGAIFTKLGNAITVAAKAGGGDPDTNFQLRLAIDQAKQASMPKDNIERAVKRGTGELEGGAIEEITYEGYGPDGVAFLIESLTDNRNRTSSDIKHILTKHGGSLGSPGSVAWMFDKKGVIRIKNVSEELQLELIDVGASDFKKDEDGAIIYCAANDLQKIKEFLDKKNTEILYAEVEQIPKDTKKVSTGQKEKLQKIFDALEENEDVNNYYTNTDA